MNLASFYEESISNGIGWRAVIFVSGCPHHCEGCQNPQTWDFKYGEKFTQERQDEIFSSIKGNSILSGVTLSGGEPFCSAKGLIPLVKRIKALGLNVWAYTGYRIEELEQLDIDGAKELLSLIDILVDGRFNKKLSRPNLVFKGSSNQRIIDVSKYREGAPVEDCILTYEEEF